MCSSDLATTSGRVSKSLMGVDAGRGGEAGAGPGERYRPLALHQRGTDDDDVPDAGLQRAGEDRIAVGVERRIAQMAVGVDQHVTRPLWSGPRPPRPPATEAA